MGKTNDQRVTEYMDHQGTHGDTCDGIEDKLKIPHQTCSPLVLTMIRDGRLVLIEEYRRTRNGQLAQVMVLAKYAKAAQPKDRFFA
jgi:hypothetical protein